MDARKGVLTQTRRHSYLAHLLGIRRILLAVNKMDLVDYDQGAFDSIAADYRAFAERIGIADWHAIPVSGLAGDNVVERGAAMAWYDGPSCSITSNSAPLDLDAEPASRCGCRCSGSIGPTWIFGASPARSRADRWRPGSGSGGAIGPDDDGRRIIAGNSDVNEAVAGTIGDAHLCRRSRLLAR